MQFILRHGVFMYVYKKIMGVKAGIPHIVGLHVLKNIIIRMHIIGTHSFRYSLQGRQLSSIRAKHDAHKCIMVKICESKNVI